MTTTVTGSGNKTTDTAALQAAIDAETSADGLVLIPAGETILLEFTGNATCITLKDNVTIRGESRETSIVRLAPGETDASGWLRMFDSGAAGVDNVTIENLRIDGNRANLGALTNTEQHHGLIFRESSNILVHNCDVVNCQGDGIAYYRNTTDSKAIGNRINNCHRVGINISHLLRGVVANNSIVGPASPTWVSGYGIKFELDPPDTGYTVGQVTVSGNYVRCTSGIGFGGQAANRLPDVVCSGNMIVAPSNSDQVFGSVATYADGITFQGNTITGYRRAVRWFGDNSDSVIADNVIRCNAVAQDTAFEAAIHVGGAATDGPINRLAVRGNIISNTTRGLSITHQSGTGNVPPENVLVDSNIIQATTGEALLLSDIDGCTITGNRLSTATGARAVWVRSIVVTPQRVDVHGNDIVGGSSENVRVEGTADKYGFANNRFSGTATRVVGLRLVGQFEQGAEASEVGAPYAAG